MLKMKRYIIYSLIILIGYAICYPNGAPEDACAERIPQHENISLKTTNVYSLTTDKSSYKKGEKVMLTLTGSSSFKGFFMVAYKKSQPDTYLGTYTKKSSVKLVNCPKGKAVTHKQNSEKNSVTIEWTPPSNLTGKITFSATVVKSYEEYWKDIKASITIT